MFRHPNYYKNLRKLARNRERVIICSAAPNTDQAISPTGRATGPGPKPQAASAKLKDPQATSDKHQAPRHKRQA